MSQQSSKKKSLPLSVLGPTLIQLRINAREDIESLWQAVNETEFPMSELDRRTDLVVHAAVIEVVNRYEPLLEASNTAAVERHARQRLRELAATALKLSKAELAELQVYAHIVEIIDGLYSVMMVNES